MNRNYLYYKIGLVTLLLGCLPFFIVVFSSTIIPSDLQCKRDSINCFTVDSLEPINVISATEASSTAFCSCTFSQGPFSTPLPFFSDNQSALDFYAYSNPLGSCANSGFELSDQLLLLLYEDLTSGEISFIFIADLPNDGSGGDMVVEISCLPPSAYIALTDDVNELTGAPPTMNGDFYWIECCTDGGIIGGLGCGYSFMFDIISMNGISTVTLLSGSPANPIYTNIPVSQCPMIFNCGGDACCQSVMTLDAMIQNTTCAVDEDGAIDLEVTGECLSQITYEWSNGETTQDLNNLPAGTYTVTVTESSGCTVDETFVVGVEFDNPEPIIQGPPWFCEGEFIDLSVLGNYIFFEWSTGETSPTIQIADGGIYYVTVTSPEGCVGTDSLIIDLEPAPSPDITGPAFICTGDTIVIDATPGFALYEWSNGENIASIKVTTPGNYSLIVTNSFGCTGEASVLITASTKPQPIISGPLSICKGGNAILSVDSLFQSYLWSTGDSTASILINNPGTYTVTVTGIEACPGVDTFMVMPADTIPLIIIGDSIRCAGDSTLLSVSGMWHEYLWSTGDTSAQILVPVPGTYSLQTLNESGCRDTAYFNTATFLNLPPEITGNNTICPNDTVVLSLNGNYQSVWWSTGSTAHTIHVSAAGVFTVATIDSNGCAGADTLIITSLPNDSTLLFVSSCNPQDTGVFASSFLNQYGCDSFVLLTVTFNLADTNLVFLTSCDPADAGVITQNLSNQFGCDSVVIINTALVPSDTIVQYATTCDPLLGDTSLMVYTNQFGCDSSIFNFIEVLPSSLDSVFFLSCNPADTGEVVQYFTNLFGCDSIIVWQTELVPEDSCALRVEVLVENGLCDGDQGQISLMATVGYFPVTARWWLQSNPSITSALWGSPSNALIVPDLSPGIYVFELTDLNGNIWQDTVELITPLPLQATIDHPNLNMGFDLACAGDTDGALLADYLSGGTHPLQFIWSDGSTDPLHVGLSVGTYSVTILDHHDCSLVLVDSITGPPVLLAGWLVSQDPCDGLPAVVVSATVQGGLPPYTYAVNGLNVAPPAWPSLAAGNRLFRVSDALGCAVDTIIKIPEESMIFVDLGPDLLVKHGTFVSLEAKLSPLGVKPIDIQWHPDFCAGCLIHGFVAKENTSISVTVYSADGCASTDDLLVEVFEDKVYIPNSFSPDFDGINDYFAPLGDLDIVVEKFSIFDRWGEEVYQHGGFKLGTPGVGWDGLFKGKLAPIEVYVYVITLRWPDGSQQLMKGDVMLMR